MSIKPQTGRRNYAKGGMIDPDEIMDPGTYGDGRRTHQMHFNPSTSIQDPGQYGFANGLGDRSRPSDMSYGEWLNLTPDKLYPKSKAGKEWKKIAPNG